MNVESEIRDLKRRVGELKGAFGFLTGQVRDVHRSILGFQEGTEERFDRLERKVDELPRALAEVVRAEFDRQDSKS